MRKPVSAVVLAACLLPVAHADERLHRYTVAIDEALSAMRVEACFAGTPPAVLVVESLDAQAVFVEGRIVEGSARRLAPNGAELSLKGLPENGCIEYAVNMAGARMKHDHSGNSTRRVGRDLFTEVGLWFWRPAQLTPDEDIEIAFRLPAGIGVSVPWRPVTGAAIPTYRVGRGAFDRPSAAAFGRFTELPVEVPGAHLRLSVLDGNPPADIEGMRRWIEDAARSVAAIYGRFPVPAPQVLILPGARAQEPTPWAYVLRGGQAASHFYVNQRRPLGDFVDDWTAPHELSHLLLPTIDYRDAWLSEGLATYYQNVSRVRSGAVTAEDAWQRIHAGFQRGRKGEPREATLAEATALMQTKGGYMRVYWQGTAILLAADVELRRLSDGKQSLDTVLEAFGRCCLDPDPEWRARDVFARFDELSGTKVFTTLYASQIDAKGFPDLSDLYRQLGLRALGGKLEVGDGPLAHIRDAIMAPGPYRTPRTLLGGNS